MAVNRIVNFASYKISIIGQGAQPAAREIINAIVAVYLPK